MDGVNSLTLSSWNPSPQGCALPSLGGNCSSERRTQKFWSCRERQSRKKIRNSEGWPQLAVNPRLLCG